MIVALVVAVPAQMNEIAQHGASTIRELTDVVDLLAFDRFARSQAGFAAAFRPLANLC
jgi:hypothetical protein